jgi:hypothetical protein
VSFTCTLIFLKQVTKGGGFDNLTKMLMDALKKHVGVFNIDVAKLLSFGIDGVNVF